MKRLNQNNPETETGFALFFWGQVLIGLAIAVALIWAVVVAANYLGKYEKDHKGQTISSVSHDAAAETALAGSDADRSGSVAADSHGSGDHSAANQSEEMAEDKAVAGNQAVHSAPKARAVQHGVAVHGDAMAAIEEKDQSAAPKVKGVAFVDAVVRPIEYELKERSLGWRPNDLILFTDNVNNFQLGVLEATRRAVTRLAERVSRTGTTNVLDKNLERAMNCFMIDPDSYMLPSAESKYNEGVEELRSYQQRLIEGEAEFYTRADNLIPLLVAFSDLLGSCDDNLVKAKEKNGKPVSIFAADNYFNYARGVASTVLPILEAVSEEFEETLITRRATDVLHHAIHSCHEAAMMDPFIVLDSDLDGIFANHRANLAAHISHARFYLDVLAATLST